MQTHTHTLKTPKECCVTGPPFNKQNSVKALTITALDNIRCTHTSLHHLEKDCSYCWCRFKKHMHTHSSISCSSLKYLFSILLPSLSIHKWSKWKKTPPKTHNITPVSPHVHMQFLQWWHLCFGPVLAGVYPSCVFEALFCPELCMTNRH